MQVLLEGFGHEMALEALEEWLLRSLTFQKREHAPRDTHNWEMLLLVQVLVRAKSKHASHSVQVLFIFVAFSAVAGDIDTINVT